MYTLYIGNKNYSSWSLRPWILMKEAGIPFEERLLQFGDEAVTDFRAALEQSRAELVQAFALRQRIDDEKPDEPTRRGLLSRSCTCAPPRTSASTPSRPPSTACATSSRTCPRCWRASSCLLYTSDAADD